MRSIATTLALSPTQDRAAHVSRGGMTVLDWSARGPVARRASRVAIPGHLERIALTGTTLFYAREVRRAGGTLATTVEALDLATRRRTVVYRPATSLPAWAALAAPARDSVFIHDCGDASRANACDLVELTATGARVVIRGIAIAHDLSADGRHAASARMVAAHPHGDDEDRRLVRGLVSVDGPSRDRVRVTAERGGRPCTLRVALVSVGSQEPT